MDAVGVLHGFCLLKGETEWNGRADPWEWVLEGQGCLPSLAILQWLNLGRNKEGAMQCNAMHDEDVGVLPAF